MITKITPIFSQLPPFIQSRVGEFLKKQFSLDTNDPDLTDKITKLYEGMKDDPSSKELWLAVAQEGGLADNNITKLSPEQVKEKVIGSFLKQADPLESKDSEKLQIKSKKKKKHKKKEALTDKGMELSKANNYYLIVEKRNSTTEIIPIESEKSKLPFDPLKKKFFKEILSSWHLGDTLTFMDILGVELLRSLNKLEMLFIKPATRQIYSQRIKPKILECYSYLMTSISFFSSLNGRQYKGDKKIEKYKKDLLKTPYFIDVRQFQSFINQLIIEAKKISEIENKPSIQVAIAQLKELTDQIIDLAKIESKGFFPFLFALNNFRDTEEINEGSNILFLNDLIYFLDFLHNSYSVQGFIDNVFINLTSMLKDYLKEIQSKPADRKSVKLFYEQFRNRIKELLKSYEKMKQKFSGNLEKKVALSKDVRINIVPASSSALVNQVQIAYLLLAHLTDVLTLIEKRIVLPQFPKFMSLFDYLTRFSINFMQLLTDHQNISKSLLPAIQPLRELDNNDQDLLNLFKKFQKEMNEFFLDFYNISHLSISVDEGFAFQDEMLNPSTVVRDFEPFFTKFHPFRKALPAFLVKLTELRKKHLKDVEDTLSKFPGKVIKKDAIVSEIKEFYFNSSLPICRFIMVLQDVRAILRHEKTHKAILNGESILLPDDLIDFMDFEGLEEAAERGFHSINLSGIRELFMEVEIEPKTTIESSDSDDEDIEDFEDIETDAPIIHTRTRKKSEPIVVTYDTHGAGKKGIKQPKSHKFKRRKILEKLQQRNFWGAPGKGSHQNFTNRDDEKKKTTLPSHGSLKKGTLKAVERVTGKI